MQNERSITLALGILSFLVGTMYQKIYQESEMEFKSIAIAVLCGLACHAAEPKKLFIDPGTRWISIHDQQGNGARAELSRNLEKTCGTSVALVDEKSLADYSILVDRTGVSAGSAMIYRNGTLFNSFKPGHTVTLKQVAERICKSIGE